MENMSTVSIEVPADLAKLMASIPPEGEFERNAMLLYPFVQNMTISHGRAAEILGVHKLDLIAYYGNLGLPFLDLSEDELNKERMVFQRLKGRA